MLPYEAAPDIPHTAPQVLQINSIHHIMLFLYHIYLFTITATIHKGFFHLVKAISQ